jgi:lipopolysaccharide biosynthesis glycosyltransferase
MNIAFTICSNNYLAQAYLLAKSFLANNQHYSFKIGLVDELQTNVAYDKIANVEVIPCKDVVPASMLSNMVARYKIVELNTSVKPFYFNHFFTAYNDCKVVYLDPDIYIYNSIAPIDTLMENYSILLTPHIYSPIPDDGNTPTERAFIKYGIYNLGFIALKKTAETERFVKWLMDRLSLYCYSENQLGIYVDQSWINFVPIFFQNVHIVRHFGFNAAYWNLHERTYQLRNDTWYVNEDPLIFFHFSALALNDIGAYSPYQTRFKHNRPDVLPLFADYVAEYRHALQIFPKSVPCMYMQRSIMDKFKYYYNRFMIRKYL